MIKVFISQPMRGKDRADIIEERVKIGRHAETLFGKGNFDIVDSLFNEIHLDPENPLWDLGRSLQLLSTADAVIFAQGWEDARGCRIEHMAAEEYGKEIYYVK